MRGISGSKDAHLGAKIRKLRKQQHMTQEKLAEKAEIDTSYLGQIERGERRSPSITIISKIANALNVKEGELLNDRNHEEGRGDSIKAQSVGIPERIADELSRMTPKEQRLYDRIFRVLKELSDLRE